MTHFTTAQIEKLNAIFDLNQVNGVVSPEAFFDLVCLAHGVGAEYQPPRRSHRRKSSITEAIVESHCGSNNNLKGKLDSLDRRYMKMFLNTESIVGLRLFVVFGNIFMIITIIIF